MRRADIFEDCLARMPLKDQKRALAALLDYDGYFSYGKPSKPVDVAFIREWLGESAKPTVRIQSLNWKYVKEQYEKAIVRLEDGDAAGTITIAKSILEAVCRHILDSMGSSYDHKENLLKVVRKSLRINQFVAER